MSWLRDLGGTAAAALALLGACAGCEGAGGSSAGGAGGLPRAADGTDVAACFDGNCEIRVRGRTTIPLNARFGFTRFSYDPGDSTWRYAYRTGGRGSTQMRGIGTNISWLGTSPSRMLRLRVIARDGDAAVISLGS
ncbi:hypothetical protein [Actinocorallia sp. A-T 12471]|uniref:hypothetical protein n=1 Tax=Actinocorallia sp. A-T 12471 TaxID=3089813 RepID=UPI0029D07F67|nr:hypothetical protein [Actinocorallia sp. A-T 12471]MDX6738712.1 hypothetical protein [Actinocorallia sp. A-T 12471]